MDQSPNSRKREIIAVLSVLIVIVAIVAAITVLNKDDAKESDSANTTDTSVGTDNSTSSSSDDSQATNAEYKDGQYTATGNYNSPGGTEDITVTVTLKDGVITDTSAQANASGATAKEYQGKFISGYKDLVVGKSIDSVSLDRVSGSSLTSGGFNRAIEDIIEQAQV